MSVTRYPTYKDSGVEWLGEVPSHWLIVPPKHAMRSKSGGVTIKGDAADQPAEGFYQGFSASGPDVWLPTYEFDCPGLVLSAVGARCGKVFKADGKWGVVANTHCFLPKQGFSRDFLWHLINDEKWWEKGGTAQPFVRVAETLARNWVFPPLHEQTAIAAFLDRETAKIDALVEEQRRLIALLKEKRQAVISHAVTKGLDPLALMKNSGIEWLGEVPVHWETAPLKRWWTVTDCKHVTAEFVPDGLPVASIKEVQSRYVDLREAKQTTMEFFDQLREGGRAPQAGDLVFTRNATVGEVALVADWHAAFAMGQDVCLLRRSRKDFSPDFLWHVLNSSSIDLQLNNLMIGSTFKRINVEEVRNLIVVFPPPQEQTTVAAGLDILTADLEGLIGEASNAVALLLERRAALISAAVTGKIDVRNLTPAEVEAA